MTDTEPETNTAPPAHLSDEAAAIWSRAVEAYVLEHHHLRVLQAACEAWDRLQGARRVLDDEGIVIRDRFGVAKPHPANAIELDARIAFARLIRELRLDSAADQDVRMPRMEGPII